MKDNLKSNFSFWKAFFFLLIFGLAIWSGGSVTVSVFEKSVEAHVWVIIFLAILLTYLYGFCKKLTKKVCTFFCKEPNHETGMESLQIAFSGAMVKDFKLTEKYIAKAKKHLGNIPLISWIEGQWLLTKNDNHAAKAVFYALCEREKNTSLGAYGLCKIAQIERSQTDLINAINSVLKIYPDAIELRFQAVAASLKMQDFVEAKKHISAIKQTKKGRLVEAVIYMEEGSLKSDLDLAKRAFKLAPQLSKNAMSYASMLLKAGECKAAQKVLFESFCHTQIKEVYGAYIACGSPTIQEKLKRADKIMHAVPGNWIVHYGFAELAMEDGLIQMAFNHFLEAYQVEQYDFIADMLLRSAKMLENTNEQAVIDVLSNPIKSEKVRFSWKCENCGYEDFSYSAICNNCDGISEYYPAYLPANQRILIEQD